MARRNPLFYLYTDHRKIGCELNAILITALELLVALCGFEPQPHGVKGQHSTVKLKGIKLENRGGIEPHASGLRGRHRTIQDFTLSIHEVLLSSMTISDQNCSDTRHFVVKFDYHSADRRDLGPNPNIIVTVIDDSNT